jgi:glucosamine--fructose-6-phosphate aminotransferase (isomerizing)
MSPTPFERDIADQPDALRAFAHAGPPPGLSQLLEARYDRVVLTGMGSSHYAALPSWRRLVANGIAAWWVDTGQLLDSPRLVTPRTLLIATSQSGASGELVTLLGSQSGIAPAALVAVTNDPDSPLAAAADAVVALHCGDEATVSTKSYLNTLAAHQRLTAALLGAPDDDGLDAAKALDEFTGTALLTEVASAFAGAPDSRLAFIGFDDHAATALYAGLITKEGAKIPAEGYIGRQFRHGPLELAGSGLTAVLFGGSDPARNTSLLRLGRDLIAAGSAVVAVANGELPDAIRICPPAASLTAQLVHGAVVAQHLTVALARARGVTPGAFTYGSKVTTAL